LFVGGNIGSVSSIYTNGTFVAGTGTTMFGDGYITKTNGRLTVSASQNILASSRLDAPYLNRWFLSPLLNNTVYGAARATTTVGTGPGSIAFDGSHVWVANNTTNDVSKIDATTNLVVATTTVGAIPYGVAFDGKNVWVANFNSNNVSKIDVLTNSVVATTAVGSGPAGVVFDGSHIWVSNFNSNNVSKLPIGGGSGSDLFLNTTLHAGNTYTSGTATFTNGINQIWTTSTNPRSLSGAALTGSAKPGITIGSYAYVPDGNNLKVFDISNPNNVDLVSSLNVGETITSSMTYDGHILYF
jgi:YVTN family beta-propeller protein